MGSGHQSDLFESADSGAAPREAAGESSPGDIAARVERLLAEPLAARGYRLLDAIFRHEGRWVLRLMIDREQGVNLDDCGAVSELAGRILDVEDPIPHHFVLEVTSPGLFRALKETKHFRQSVGKLVRLTLAPGVLPGRAERVVRGVLETVQDNEIAVRETEGPIAVPLAAIKAARLDPDPWAGPPAGATQAVAPQAVAPRAKGAGSKSQGRDPKP